MRPNIQCSASVYYSGEFRPSPCTKKAMVTRDGKAYCTIHDPVRVKIKAEERDAKWAKKNAEIDRRSIKTAAYRNIAKIAVEQADGSGDMNPIIEAVRIWEELP